MGSNMKFKHALLGLVAFGMLATAFAVVAATPDRYTGPREIWTCTIEDVLVATDLDFCSFIMPQAAIIENVQVHCLTIGNDPAIQIDTGATIYVVAQDLAAAGVILQPTIAIAAVADEAIVDVHIIADADAVATGCQVMITWYRH